MEYLSSVVKWMLQNEWLRFDIAAAAVISFLVFFGLVWVLTRLERVLPWLPKPLYLAAPILLLELFTIPSVPRYVFEWEALDEVGKPWVRIIDRQTRSHLIEPATWIRPPLDSITGVAPLLGSMNGLYRQVTFKHGADPSGALIEPECRHHTITYAYPDTEGIFRSLPPRDMTEADQQLYCKSDWTAERNAMRQQMLGAEAGSASEQ